MNTIVSKQSQFCMHPPRAVMTLIGQLLNSSVGNSSIYLAESWKLPSIAFIILFSLTVIRDTCQVGTWMIDSDKRRSTVVPAYVCKDRPFGQTEVVLQDRFIAMEVIILDISEWSYKPGGLWCRWHSRPQSTVLKLLTYSIIINDSPQPSAYTSNTAPIFLTTGVLSC